MECTVVYRCECNERGYPSHFSLKQHQKTKQHVTWAERNELRLLKIDLTEKTNTIMALEIVVKDVRDLNTVLLKRLLT
jgi:hypothetical protein